MGRHGNWLPMTTPAIPPTAPSAARPPEARPSVLEEHLRSGPCVHPGHRVVAGQRLLQAAGDIFLGWMSGPQGRALYWRQPRDMKGSADVAG